MARKPPPDQGGKGGESPPSESVTGDSMAAFQNLTRRLLAVSPAELREAQSAQPKKSGRKTSN